MTHRYASSRFRTVLLTAMLIIGGVLVASASAQESNTAASTAASSRGIMSRLFSIVISNPDAVFFIIVALSITGLTLIIQGFIKNRASVFMPEATTASIREMIAQRRFKDLIDFTETDPSFISRALNPALKRAPAFSSMKEAMETAVAEQTAEQFRRIEYLNIIGNLGPLLGLLGTVLGMIEAFSQMQDAGGNANPAQLAGGISRALAHTFMGLFLAVPCLACFGILRTMVDRLTVRGALVAEDLLLMIKPAEAKPAPGSIAGAAGGGGSGVAGLRATPQPTMPQPAVPSPVMPPPPPRKPSATPQPQGFNPTP